MWQEHYLQNAERDLCNATKRSAKIDEERWIEEQCKNIQHYVGERKTREAYRLLKAVKATQKPRISLIKDKEGRVSTDKEQAQYCDNYIQIATPRMKVHVLVHVLANISPLFAMNEPIYSLEFADNLDLKDKDPDNLQVMLNKLCEDSERYGMCINKDQKKAMTFRRSVQSDELTLSIHGIQVEYVQNFIYIGSSVG